MEEETVRSSEVPVTKVTAVSSSHEIVNYLI